MAVGHENVAGCIPRDVRRPVESVSCAAYTRCAAAALPGATFASRAFCRWWLDNANVDCFRLSAHDHQYASFRTEFDDLAGRLINCPDVVLRIDSNTVGHQKTIDALTNLSNVVPVLIELKQT